MKFIRSLSLLLFAVMLCPAAHAQAHSVSLAWTASTDGGTVNVYRIPGSCPSSTTTGNGTKLTAAPVAGTTYVDSTVLVGSYCYYVTAVLSGAESVPSNLVPAVILPSAPTAVHTTATS